MPDRIENFSMLGSIQLAQGNDTDRVFEITWYTGSRIARYGLSGKYYIEFDMSPGAADLSRLESGRAPFLSDHYASTWSVIGVIQKAWIENGVGKAAVRLSKREEVNAIFEDMKDGILRNVSMGVNILKAEIIERDEEDNPVYLVTKWQPCEVSLVAVGADPNAAAMSDKARGDALLLHLTQLTEGGKSMPNKTKEKEFLEDGGADSTQTSVQTLGKVKTPLEEQKKEREELNDLNRVREILTSASALNLSVSQVESILSSGVDVKEARRQMFELKAEQTKGIKAGFESLSFGVEEVEKRRVAMSQVLLHRSTPEVFKLEDGNPYRGMRLLDLARECLEEAGIKTKGMPAAKIAREALMNTTSDFPQVVDNVVSRTLRRTYELAPPTFPAFCRRSTVSDFREKAIVALGDVKLLDVLESGEYKETSFNHNEERYKISKFGRIISVTLESIVNDDLDIMTRVPEVLGAAAVRLESDIVYNLLNSNPKMSDDKQLFCTEHGNVGAGDVLDVAGLEKATEAMFSQKTETGAALNLMPKNLLVGAKNLAAGRKYTSSDYQPAKQADINTAIMTPIAEARIPGSKWFVTADPLQIDTIEYAYLDGYDAPTVVTSRGFEVDGLRIKISHFFGAGVIDFRGLWINSLA